MPYIAAVPGDYLGVGRKVIIHGWIGSNMEWIEIGLASDVQGTERPIVIRIGDHKFLAKFYKNNEWRNYESYDQKDEYPLEDNKRFTFEIERVSSKYRILVNDKYFHEYNYRFETELARYLKINGDGEFMINLIEFAKVEDNTIDYNV